MAVTSLVIPPLATWWWVAGLARAPKVSARRPTPPVDAVLFDRDGTLIQDVPYNGDPRLVRPQPGAGEAVRRLRERGLAVGMITNQSGVARGTLTPTAVGQVNEAVEELLGPFEVVRSCPHGPADGCGCRKPRPGMVLDAAQHLGVQPERCVVVGDIGSDLQAAHAAQARSVLVPTAVTRFEEVAAADAVAHDLEEAADLILAGAV